MLNESKGPNITPVRNFSKKAKHLGLKSYFNVLVHGRVLGHRASFVYQLIFLLEFSSL